MNGPKAIIFDMDGTVLDSEPIWLRADLAMIAAHGGFMSEEEHDGCIGMGTDAFISMVRDKYGLQASERDLRAFQEQTYLQIAREEIKPFPQMVEFASWARGKGIPVAIASGSPGHIIDEMMVLTGLDQLFELRVSGYEVAANKPAPDVFLEASRRLGTEPQDCLVLEDSPVGLEAAVKAGMRCIAVPPPVLYRKGFDYSKADTVFTGGMTEFSAAAMEAWIAENY